jgi:hypothetical protein
VHKYGSANFNQPASLAVAASELSSIFSVSYPMVYENSKPSISSLYANLSLYHPLFGGWRYYVGPAVYYHMSVIKGYDDGYERIYVMDPWNATTYYGTHSSGDNYSYTNSSVGVTLGLKGYASKY